MDRWRSRHRSTSIFHCMSASTQITPSEKKSALTPAFSMNIKVGRRCPHRAVIGAPHLRRSRRVEDSPPYPEVLGKGERQFQAVQKIQELDRKQSLKPELWFFAGLILLLNLPLLNGTWASDFAFHPGLVGQGEWWRVLTFPFVHVSIYHLLLDAAAFFLLYSGLREPKRSNRLAFVFASALGSLAVSLFAAPQIYSVGLCGLSGVAHGLMAISALEMMQSQTNKKILWAGAISFLFVITKAAWEAATGAVVFSAFHFGNLGTPIAVCHAGGILGVLFVWIVRNGASRCCWRWNLSRCDK